MKIEHWNLIQDIFKGALELPSSERTEYLKRVCGDDENLRCEVASLLANDNNHTATLHSLVSNNLQRLAQASVSSEIGARVGPYRLVRALGGGGMGIVYLGVRSDDHYFQIVAVKMIRNGLASPALVQRFRAERQILATLTHPNIGVILDGGDTEDGRPYIVMEYVEGQPITMASETHSLSIRQRIELFRSVCSAVRYAHQKMVVHRDIKPANVLLTPDGIVKLIDFGISKPLAPELIPGGLAATEDGRRLMTPDYASPEQLLGRKVTTATDIYSLGVVLFELLTGAQPYTLRDLSPGAAEKVVCEQEIRKPSSISGLPKQTSKTLAGDLDRIVLMMMDKDPSRRYASAEDLDQDLLRFLEGRPVRARRSTFFYRLSRFVARHKTASLMVGATSAVLAGSMLFFSLESHAADARLKHVQLLADSAISDMTQQLQQSSASVELQASVFRSTLTYLNQLRQDSGNDPRLLLKLSKAFRRVGDLEGSPVAASLGNTANAIASYKEALQTAIAARDRLSSEESLQAVVEAYQQLGQIEFFSGKLREARNHYQQSLTAARELSMRKPGDPLCNRLLATNFSGLGYVQLNSLETDQAVESLRTAVHVLGADPNGAEDHDRTLTTFYGRLGRALNEFGSNRDAIASYEKAIAIAGDLVRKFPSRRAKRELFALHNNIVGTLAGREVLNAGKVREAQMYSHKAVALAEQLAAGDTTDVQARSDLAGAYITMGDSLIITRPAEAHQWYRKSIALTKELGARSDAARALADRDETLATLLTIVQPRERLNLLEEANRIRQEIAKASPDSPLDRLHLMRSYCRLSDAELGMNNLANARKEADASMPLLNEFKLTSPSLLVVRDVGFCYQSLGNFERAVAHNRASSLAEKRAAEAQAHQWFSKSLNAWNEWARRGSATPESEVERLKVQHFL
jgi:eukaryotic-like serine/threonine-protein kinase